MQTTLDAVSANVVKIQESMQDEVTRSRSAAAEAREKQAHAEAQLAELRTKLDQIPERNRRKFGL